MFFVFYYINISLFCFFFFSSRRRHTRYWRDWSSDVCSSDLAAVPADAPLVIAPGARVLVPTGIAIALGEGTEGQVRPRSGLAMRHGLTVANAPGTIDADYRGELQVLLVNLGGES